MNRYVRENMICPLKCEVREHHVEIELEASRPWATTRRERMIFAFLSVASSQQSLHLNGLTPHSLLPLNAPSELALASGLDDTVAVVFGFPPSFPLFNCLAAPSGRLPTRLLRFRRFRTPPAAVTVVAI
uniref:Uncharacterized protein n=1 Tax=Grammatophora oceanica TaxID=210454 RepID=A0A7S1YBF2_9STRA|mmetsp:Transcript_36995/g.55097  ORF Transcript_36995/g.55097 Transcript_36995/m.55097 type:complete len:129 (+) Transcript_36995:187-573(+)